MRHDEKLSRCKIAEVARIVNYLKKHAVGRTISAVKTQEDDVGTHISRKQNQNGV